MQLCILSKEISCNWCILICLKQHPFLIENKTNTYPTLPHWICPQPGLLWRKGPAKLEEQPPGIPKNGLPRPVGCWWSLGLPSANQTWLAGKSLVNAGVLMGKSSLSGDKWEIAQVCLMCSWWWKDWNRCSSRKLVQICLCLIPLAALKDHSFGDGSILATPKPCDEEHWKLPNSNGCL